jgi:TetR/AcrR family transcriptional regulator, cholesterol catabolism regulator
MQPERTAYDEKLENILRISAQIFAEKGYHQASIRDIAKATKVSLSGLYYYFSSKEELLYLVQDHAFGSLLDALDDLLKGVDDPVRRLQIVVANHLRYFVGNMAEMKVLSHEAGSLTGEYRRRVNAKKRRLTEVVTEILREIRPRPEVDLRVATFALFGMMNWLYNWYRPEEDLSVEGLADQISRLFLHGFLKEGDALPLPRRGPETERRPMWRSAAEAEPS